jgi:hypothetical protein
MSESAAPYNDSHRILSNPPKHVYTEEEIVPNPSTAGWYKTRYGCLKSDPTQIARRHTFPDAPLPRGFAKQAAPFTRDCLSYRTAWPFQEVDGSSLVETERNHPSVGFFVGVPVTPAQIDVESHLRRLDQPLGNCQPTVAEHAPLFRNTVAPPPPVHVSRAVQNASNPVVAILSEERDRCRREADTMASSLSNRTFHNPTRQDTALFAVPFAPPGIGSYAK